jgi:glutamyl-tRNA synthetase
MFEEYPTYSTNDLVGTQEATAVARLLKIAEWEMEKIRDWNRDAVADLFQQMAQIEEIKLKSLLRPFFFAISGSAVSLPLFDTIYLLGPDLIRVRIRNALLKLSETGAGLSKKGLKSLEKEYQSYYGNRID